MNTTHNDSRKIERIRDWKRSNWICQSNLVSSWHRSGPKLTRIGWHSFFLKRIEKMGVTSSEMMHAIFSEDLCLKTIFLHCKHLFKVMASTNNFLSIFGNPPVNIKWLVPYHARALPHWINALFVGII